MIISNPRDERVAAWVATWATPAQVAQAVAELGAQAWPARVAKRLGRGKIPPEVWDEAPKPPSAEIRAKLAELRRQMT
jgi:hypothetical protein